LNGWHRLHVFPRLAQVRNIPALEQVTCFPALDAGYITYILHVFPRLVGVARFASSPDWFVALFTFAVIGQFSLLWFWFNDSCTKTEPCTHCIIDAKAQNSVETKTHKAYGYAF